jgi:hypothetical protein
MDTQTMNWAKSEKFEPALKVAAEGLEKLFVSPTKKSHLMHNADGHPWIRLIRPMDEVRYIGFTPLRGTGPVCLKLRVFLYVEHQRALRRLFNGKKFSFEGIALSRDTAIPGDSWLSELAKEGKSIKGYESTIEIDAWSEVNAESRLRHLIEDFCCFVQAVVTGDAAYEALPNVAEPALVPLWTEDQAAIDLIGNQTDLSVSQREALVKLRIGQGWFRQQLVDRWDGCSVTGCKMVDYLVASHIVPWSKCATSDERWCADNGLLLTPSLDKLFDRGLIGFENNGNIVLSSALPVGHMHHFGVSKTLRLRREVFSRFPDIGNYLSKHRQVNGLDTATL